MMFGYGASMWWMWLFGLLALAGLVILIVVIVRVTLAGTTQKEGGRDAPAAPEVEAAKTARQILDERYARGELTTQEYRERLTVLGEDQ